MATPNTWEYVIVGSGAGGGPLAANLAGAGHKVLLLEAGGDHGDRPSYRVPAFHGMATEDKNMEWDYFVKHYSDEARQRLDSKFDPQHKGIWYPRAGTLGGCTAHNALITVYPHNKDWDDIATATNDPSWKGDQMRKYFQKLERCEYMDPPAVSGFDHTRHGFTGWLKTSKADPKLAANDAQLLKTVATAALTALMSHVEDPKALAARIMAKANIGLGHALEIFRLLLQDPFDPAAFAGLLVDNSLELLERLMDPNDWEFVKNSLEGLCIVPLAVDGGKQDPANRGRRNGPREYIKKIEEQSQGNLTVQAHALATKVLFDKADKTKAVGVEYLVGEHLYRADPRPSDQAGETRQAFASREVILAAGAFNTPQLLLLSGIGPRAEVEKFEDKDGKPLVECRVDLPGVGKNLQDRYEVGVISDLAADFKLLEGATFKAPDPGPDYDNALQTDPVLKQWDQAGTGIYATNGAVIAIIMKSKPDREGDPDLFLFGLPGYFKGYFQTYSEQFEERKNRFTWAILKAHTNNRAGTVTLRSADARDVPEINFRYFDEGEAGLGDDKKGEDLEAVLAGVKFVQRMTRLNGFITDGTLGGKGALDLGGQVTDDQIKEVIKREAWGHHACGTCKIGADNDPDAVLDSNFRVRGTKNLRVVDASVFPRIPGFFIVTPIYMVSEKASQVLLDAAGPPGP